jgi:hypothetical protein
MQTMPIEFQVLIATTAIGLAGWMGGSLLKVLREIRDQIIELKLEQQKQGHGLGGVKETQVQHHDWLQTLDKRILRLEAKN